MSRSSRPRTPLRAPGRALSACLSLLIAAIVAGCAGPPTVLTGTIKDAYTGEPVPQASVVIGDTTVTTDASGVFRTDSWSKEDTLAVNAPNYEPISLALAGRPEVAQTDALTVTLDTALRPNVLAGVITDEFTGEPVAGAEVAVTVDISNTLTAATGADGRYSLSGVPEAFTVNISAPDYEASASNISRSTAHDVALRPNVLAGVVTDRFTGQPVAGATVEVGAASATTGADGAYRVEGVPAGVTSVEISADGYASLSQELGRSTALDAVLRPDTLAGTLVDKLTGEPVANATVIATTTLPGTEVAFERIDDSSDGSFTLRGLPEQGFVQVLAPGYKKAVVEIKPGELPTEIALEPFKVKALYITAAVASVPSLVDEYIDLINRTELNALMVDLKSDLRDDLGLLYYDSQVPLAKELGLSADYVDMPALVQKLKDNGIYTIARIQLFSHDNALSDARPEWSIRYKETGEVYADYPAGLDGGIRYAYLDPSNKNVWDYNIQLGIEAAQMGFDEVNYDYVRFPDIKKETVRDTLLFSEPLDPIGNPGRMFEIIGEFAEMSHRAVNGAGAYTSLDVFGRVVLGPSLTISQDMTLLGDRADYIAPMPYPSLWWTGVFGVDVPVRYPYETIKGSVDAGVEQMRGTYGRMRTWLQDHTDPWSPVVVVYGPDEVRAQIRATEENPEAWGWMLYDSANAYRGAFGGAVDPEE